MFEKFNRDLLYKVNNFLYALAVIPTLESLTAKVVIEHLDCYQLSKDDPRRMVIENNKPPVSKEWIK